ncbi:hypothetical protein GH5_03115 [Leishmania sp. Ghana 2012 LV757]|uniref:hypothetical protein n=1 Tax=Leishmania sp. Ghana 2012 LV757 TaxID=2803181 RepID=UPI001B631A64|nr:hypothetical protein GH5_03115 [Leishmania sp. Ghana 2012 LV757]
MHTSAPTCCDGLVTLPTAELRESLENILVAIGASERSCVEEGRALEAQRQRVLRLLSKLDVMSDLHKSPDTIESRKGVLISPSCAETNDDGSGLLDASSNSTEKAHARSKVSRGTLREAVADAGDVPTTLVSHPNHRCLLGNLFSQPRRPYMAASLDTSSCVSSPPTRWKVEEGWSDGRNESVSDICAAATVSRQLGHFCCPPERELSPSHHGRASARERYNAPSSLLRDRREKENYPKRRQPSLCTPSVQLSAQRSRQRSSGSKLPCSFWINVWPCLGGTVASRARRPTRVLVQGRCRYFEDVLEKAAKLTNCQPAPHCFYTPDGCLIRDLEDLIAEHHYLLFSSGGLYRRESVPTALLWLLYTDARHIVECS